ncbi:amino acid ABC transporter permease [Micromonospora sp. NPDC048830]|uniref:amino acid ABC transporter permease n=1 Tax=Micromonospora sp. NPDC048830 TaxID=3364257 RepID=UPI0037144AA0
MVAVYAALVLTRFFVFNENWQWDVVGSYLFSKVVMEGLRNTIYLTLCTTALGLVLGVITAWCRMSHLVVLRTAAVLYIWVMRAMPPLVMLLLVFFFGALVPTLSIGIPFGPTFASVPANDVITRFSAAVIGLSIYLGAYSAEIFRSGVMALHSGQFEACKALGLPPLAAYRRILGPQLIRVITPSMANEVITIFKSTALVSVIGYRELLTTVQVIYAKNFETIPLLTVAVIWYLVLTSVAMFGQSRLEKRFGRGFNRRHRPVSKEVSTDLAAGVSR